MAKFKNGDLAIVKAKSRAMNGFEIGDEVVIEDTENTEKLSLRIKHLEKGVIGYADEKHLKLKGEGKITITQPDGSVIEGTAEELAKLLKELQSEEEAKAEVELKPAVEDVKSPLEKAKEEFPVGAKVRITVPEGEETDMYRAGVTNDEVGTVEDVQERHIEGGGVIVQVYFPSHGSGWRGLPQELEVVEKAPEFEVGDLVKAKPGNPYSATNEDMKVGEVVEPSLSTNNGGIRVKILVHEEEVIEGMEFDVDPEHFEKI